MSPDETMRMLHELTVYKIELELQNEQLKRSQEDLETALARYTELYVLAPVAYFTMNNDGVISETNQAGAELVDLNRSQVPRKSFGSFVDSGEQAAFWVFLQRVFASGAREACEVSLAGKVAPRVRITAKLTSDRSQADLVVMEIGDL